MNRLTSTYKVSDTTIFKQQMLNWSNQFNICCFFDNNHYTSQYNSFECLLAVDAINFFNVSPSNKANLIELKSFVNETKDWIFGHISYDFKNSIFQSTSNNTDVLEFPELYLFQPKVVIKLFSSHVVIETIEIAPIKIFERITSTNITNPITTKKSVIVKPRISKTHYFEKVNALKNHIQLGDCYEINFCQEFYAENIEVDPFQIFNKLNTISPTPFSVYYKLNNKYVLCASPERFIKKQANKIISQPIKGTSKRDLQNEHKDLISKQSLAKSQKEKSENVMIVDLVRNDLSKIATKKSVNVDELFGIYSFPQVHQMISTISATVDDNIDFVDILKATFPMGSMTGAPKHKVMQLIEEYEESKRGIYSGSIGYITPNKDFDFNVVIRSIMYNETLKFLNYQVGGAITHYSNPEDEYEECLLKAKAIERALI
ncbi:MAG: anthranilate synthase component I family protein [Chitinophagaceae bacterium]